MFPAVSHQPPSGPIYFPVMPSGGCRGCRTVPGCHRFHAFTGGMRPPSAAIMGTFRQSSSRKRAMRLLLLTPAHLAIAGTVASIAAPESLMITVLTVLPSAASQHARKSPLVRMIPRMMNLMLFIVACI